MLIVSSALEADAGGSLVQEFKFRNKKEDRWGGKERGREGGREVGKEGGRGLWCQM